MASSMPVTMDTPITIKVLIEGSNKRLKVPLKDLGANTFEDKLRSLLSIPSNQGVRFERYSDSSGSYVYLDPANPQVYKTLFRAAKAKLKLRVKATITDIEDTGVAVAPEEQTTASPAAPEPSASNETLVNPVKEQKSEEAEGEAPVPRPFEAASASWGKVSPLQSKLALRGKKAGLAASLFPTMSSWSVYCNHCDKPMANEHYHCSICDDGDYDLCTSCVDAGRHCYSGEHWLIKRLVQNGQFVNSTSEKIAGKSKRSLEVPAEPVEEKKAASPVTAAPKPVAPEADIESRTCNSCVKVLPETEFVTCQNCEDFDLCIPCHVGNKHGHHPGHAFRPATPETSIGPLAEFLCTPGRNVRHAAVCDGCDKFIYGIRHKCLNCPDWDFCSKCIKSAKFIHPAHRFVSIYDPLPEPRSMAVRHYGIYCDGPLCKDKDTAVYIQGPRYKCAVCHDTDFCANCEASPSNRHNRTHPLIMFKSPVRNVSVTTMGEDKHGASMGSMGDQLPRRSTSTETVPVSSVNAATQVQTIVDLKPSEPSPKEHPKIKDLLSEPIQEKIKVQDLLSTVESPKETNSNELAAHFVFDTVTDGTKVLPGALFSQVWTLRNPGPREWPTGCSVRYVGGDNMLNVDDNHPSSADEINEATESNVVKRSVKVGEEISFRVLMKAPKREGTAISYWRLKAADGTPFGHRLWCHIDVTNQVINSVPKDVTSKPQTPDLTYEMQLQLLEQHSRKRVQMAKQERMRQGQQPSSTVAKSHPNETLDAALKKHAEVRAQVIENMRRAADRMNAELERMGKPKDEVKPVESSTQPQAPPKPTVESVSEPEQSRSTMIFPQLEKESPVSSTHEAVTAPESNADIDHAETETETDTLMSPSVKGELEFFGDAETVHYSDSDSDDGFATDEEYDILDASDQELP